MSTLTISSTSRRKTAVKLLNEPFVSILLDELYVLFTDCLLGPFVT
jgi:hypothetical protein